MEDVAFGSPGSLIMSDMAEHVTQTVLELVYWCSMAMGLPPPGNTSQTYLVPGEPPIM